MKTKYLDSELQRLSVLEKQGALSVFGRETLIEFKAIKQALTIPDVSKQRELLIAYTEYLAQQDITTSTYWLEVYNVDAFLKSNL
jgi:hypothetical protein